MSVLVTRPEVDAERLAAELRSRGHEPILSPLMKIRLLNGPDIPLKRFQAVLATSANGIRSLACRTRDRDVPVFAVGPQTASAAHEGGFQTVRNAGGDAATLADMVRKLADPNGAPLLHLAGRERAGGLAEALTAAGFSVETVVLYEAVETLGFSDEALAALAAETIEAVMLFSPRSARLFAEHLEKAGLREKSRGIAALCISAAAAAPLKFLPLKTIQVARRPDEAAMLALLDETTAAP